MVLITVTYLLCTKYALTFFSTSVSEPACQSIPVSVLMIENDCDETIRYTSAVFTSSLSTRYADDRTRSTAHGKYISFHIRKSARVAIKTVRLTIPVHIEKRHVEFAQIMILHERMLIEERALLR